MPRPLRLDYPGAHFHIVSRGVERRAIFIDTADRSCFLKILSTACERYGGVCHAYCLMGNHYHLLIESREARIKSVMQHLNGSYGRWFNRRRERVGHLFQGRFKASLVDSDGYLLEAVRYVELNPCRAGLVDEPTAWEWSSFRPRMGLDPAPPFLCVDRVLGRFGQGDAATANYRRFVLAGISDEIGERLRSEAIVGSPEFVSHHAKRASELRTRQQVPPHQAAAGRPRLAALLSGSDRASRRSQAVQAFVAHGYPMSQIARRLGVHYTTVSRWVREGGRGGGEGEM